MAKSKHDQIAERIARQLGTDYNRGKGPDVQSPRRVVEVKKTAAEIPEALRQLRGTPKLRYIALPNPELDAALNRVRDLKVGIMDEQGKVVKPAQQPKRK